MKIVSWKDGAVRRLKKHETDYDMNIRALSHSSEGVSLSTSFDGREFRFNLTHEEAKRLAEDLAFIVRKRGGQ